MNSYTFHITFYDAAFFAEICIGLTFTVLLWFSKRANSTANRFLAAALVVVVLWITRILNIDIRLETYFAHWSWLPLQFSLVFGPLIFFYVLKITRAEYQFRRGDLLHFSPLLLEMGVQLLAVRECMKTGESTYNTQIFHQLNPILQLLAFISVSVYLYRSHRLIERFYRRQKFNSGDRYRHGLRWLHQLLIGFALLWALWIPFAAIGHFGDTLYLLLVSAMIWISARAFLKPEVSVSSDQLPFFKPSAPAELRQKGAWLKKAIKEHRYYQDPELTLGLLAEKLGQTTHELSRTINTVFKKSFNDFVNEYRVADVIRKMQDASYNHITLLGIALESGFNSQSTFTRIFKHVTGKSPVEYKNELKKDCLSYNLGSDAQFRTVISYHKTTPKWSHSTESNRKFMIKNYFKTAYRSLTKNKGFSIINILGLSLGLTACLLIVYYVADEFSYDHYNLQAGRVFRINEDIRFGGNTFAYAQAPAPLADVLHNEFPQVLHTVRFHSAGPLNAEKGGVILQEDKVTYADPGLFDVFTLPLIAGDARTALKEPHSVVITESIAKKYFNSSNVVGRIFTFDDTVSYKITAVIRDIPTQSHFNFDFFLSMSTLPDSKDPGWLSNDYNTYILLKKGADVSKLDRQLPALINRYIGPQLQGAVHLSMNDFEKSGNYFRFSLMPLTAIHLDSARIGELGQNGDRLYVYLFLVIAVVILLIACVNFMNLSTAHSAGRAREVGVRKVLGSPRKYLIAQFLTESILLAFIASVIAILSAGLLLPAFDQLSGKELTITVHSLVWLFPALAALTLIIGAVAGSYPAFFLSSFNPIDVLKGKLSAGFKGGTLRNILVVSQFSISIFLIFGTLVIHRQIHFIRTKNPGFDRDQVVIVHNVGGAGNRARILKEEVKKLPGVVDATLTGFLPTSKARNSSGLFQDQALDQKKAIQSQIWTVDEDYLPTLGMKLVAGRNFSAGRVSDSSAMIVNEAAARLLTAGDPLGKTLYYPLDDRVKAVKPYHIIGVARDFNFSSFRNNITPLCFILGDDQGALSIKFKWAGIAATLPLIAQQWKQFGAPAAFNYSFMDQDFDATYRTEQRMGKVFVAFTILALGIACLGLFGLAAYASEQRNREIGIRKLLGATAGGIVRMLSIDFMKLVLIALLIAAPVSWYVMEQWLQGFAYRITLVWWMPVSSGVLALLVAFLTICFQSLKAARMLPVKSLKNE